ncbi:hypothetical protein ABZS66_50625 [Dactylosporangium sp. NPDC005572]|uniref:hypothetical protein n=1 Tax=Dactylosporangium sp. NPDC005572 TaxID=3156889 RepID=UPI0033A99A53
MRWWALASGVLGLAADLLLVAFYAVAQPWTDAPHETSLGAVNDYLVIFQFAALLPVVVGLGRRLPPARRVRVWTAIGAGACVAVVVLQVLLVTGVLPFDVQVGLVSAGSVASMLWAGAISDSPANPAPVRRLGRILLAGVPVAMLAFLAGTVVTVAAGVDWAWVAGGAVGTILWFLFPLWAVLLGVTSPGRTPLSAAELR